MIMCHIRLQYGHRILIDMHLYYRKFLVIPYHVLSLYNTAKHMTGHLTGNL